MPRSILIVEDELVSALFLTHCIKRLGHHVVGTVSTGEEAIAEACRLKPDLVIMDVGLRGDLDGIEAARIINERQSVSILFISAYTYDEICRRTELPKVFDYLAKPFGEVELEERLRVIFSPGD